MFQEYLSQFGFEIVSLLFTGILGLLGLIAKKIAQKVLNDKTKENIARIAVRAVEQMYKDLHGEEKLIKALEAAAKLLTDKGITVTEYELRILLEDAVGEFNEAFKKAE